MQWSQLGPFAILWSENGSNTLCHDMQMAHRPTKCKPVEVFLTIKSSALPSIICPNIFENTINR